VIDDLVAAFEAPVVALDPLDRDGWIGAVMRALALPTEPPQVELFGE
jgi:hypothetical protein